jgi:hypothetical protein
MLASRTRPPAIWKMKVHDKIEQKIAHPFLAILTCPTRLSSPGVTPPSLMYSYKSQEPHDPGRPYLPRRTASTFAV